MFGVSVCPMATKGLRGVDEGVFGMGKDTHKNGAAEENEGRHF